MFHVPGERIHTRLYETHYYRHSMLVDRLSVRPMFHWASSRLSLWSPTAAEDARELPAQALFPWNDFLARLYETQHR